MKPSAQTLREAPGSTRRASPAGLIHTLYAYCATSLLLFLVVYTFLLILLLRTVISPERSSRHPRHVTFVDPEPSASSSSAPRRAAPPPPPPPRLPEKSKPAPPPVPTRTAAPSLSLTITPRELEPPTPDVAEDPLRALGRICAFLVANTARATQREELGVTPPLAGLEPYLEAVRVDLAYIDDVVAEKRAEEEEGEGKMDNGAVATAVEISASAEDASASEDAGADSGAGAGVGVSADAHAHDEPVLVQPQQAVSAHTPPPPSQSQSPSPAPAPAPAPHPTPAPAHPPPIITDNLYPPPSTSKPKHKPKPSADPVTTMAAANPRRRKDAVLRATHARADPSVVDADADDAAVRAAALLARFADIGAELEGTVRDRGAALWAALSRRSAPLDLPVPPLPRTPSTAALIAARGAPVVEASRAVAHQAAWRARIATYSRLFGPVAAVVAEKA